MADIGPTCQSTTDTTYATAGNVIIRYMLLLELENIATTWLLG